MKIFVERIKKSIIFAPSNNKKSSYMETTKKSPIDIAAKELWQQICKLKDLLFDDIHDASSADFYYDFLKKSSEFGRYIDKNFYND